MHTKINLSNKNLAINGGKPIRTKPWSDNITTGEEEINAVKRVLKSGYLSLFEGSHTPDPPFSFLGGPEVSMIGPSLLRFHPYITGIVLGTGETVIDDIFNWDDSSGRVFFSKDFGRNNQLFNEYKPIRSKLDFSSIKVV